MENYLEFTCKLSPETSTEKLVIGNGETMLFEIWDGSKNMGVGLNKNDIEKLLPFLLKFYYE
jgi:hypothetical protein